MSNTRLIREGILNTKNEHPHLVGGKCSKCGGISFPRREFCARCLSTEIDELPLSTTGTLYSYTTTYRPVAKFQPPHSLGYIELPEGVRVLSPIVKNPDEEFRIGAKMMFSVAKLWEEEDTCVMGYQFHVAKEDD